MHMTMTHKCTLSRLTTTVIIHNKYHNNHYYLLLPLLILQNSFEKNSNTSSCLGENVYYIIEYMYLPKHAYCAPANSASYPQEDGKRVVAYGLQGEGLVWLNMAVLCLHAAPWVQLFTGTAMDSHVMRCGIISSCQSAATSRLQSASGHEPDSCKQCCSK